MPKNAAAKPRSNLASHHGKGADPEECDPTPVEIPTGKGLPPTMAEQIAHAVHAQLALRDGEEFESPEEADDFEEDDPENLDMTPYESYFVEADHEDDTPVIVEDPPPPTEEAPVQEPESEAEH